MKQSSLITRPRVDETCMGLSLEGDHLRLALVGRQGTKLFLLDLASLPVHQYKLVAAGMESSKDSSSSDPFDSVDIGENEEFDFGSIREFLTAHAARGASTSISFGDPLIRTFLMPHDPRDSAAALIRKILGDIQNSINIELKKDSIAYNTIGKSSLVAAARIETPPLLEVFTAPHGIDRHPARVNFLTSNEIALVNMVRVHFRFRPEELVHIIHVGQEETRFFVMRGYDLLFIAPPIQQGASDRDYVTMLNNRIELAAENTGYPKADHVVLAGAAEEIGLRDEILVNNPNVIFHSLTRLRIHCEHDQALANMRDYVTPISIAWQKLQPKNPHFYRLNVIPNQIRDEQNKFRLAWHGFLLLALLFLATVGITIFGLQNHARIRELDAALQFEKAQIREQQAIVQKIDDLENRSKSVIAAVNTLDTLLMGSELWSETLDTLAAGTGGLRDIWVNEMKPDKEQGYTMTGFSLSRASVPDLSHRVGQTDMKEISVQLIGKRKVFRYMLNLDPKDEYPYSGSHADAWHDSVSVALGDVSTRFSSSSRTEAAPAKGGAKGKAPAAKPGGTRPAKEDS